MNFYKFTHILLLKMMPIKTKQNQKKKMTNNQEK